MPLFAPVTMTTRPVILKQNLSTYDLKLTKVTNLLLWHQWSECFSEFFWPSCDLTLLDGATMARPVRIYKSVLPGWPKASIWVKLHKTTLAELKCPFCTHRHYLNQKFGAEIKRTPASSSPWLRASVSGLQKCPWLSNQPVRICSCSLFCLARMNTQELEKHFIESHQIMYRKPCLFWTERGYFGCSCFSMARAVLNIGAILDT